MDFLVFLIIWYIKLQEVLAMRRFGAFQYACLVWLINMIFVILSYFIPGLIHIHPVLLVAIFVSFAMMIVTWKKEQIQFAQILEFSKTWVIAIAIVSILYGFVNFFVCLYLLREGGPHIDNGIYCLWNHGFIREITKAEYEALLKVEGRMFTGHSLIFSALPVVFFSAHTNITKF